MIEQLHIENFQSHVDTKLEFDPGVNVIIGRSDSGKTAIIRALNWVCNNKPHGDDFRSHWGGDTVVTISLEDGSRVDRRKTGKTGNDYSLIIDQEVKFKAFNKDVPDDISKVINMNDLNWQRQLDSPYLLSNTSGEVASALNHVVKLDVIDSALSNINSMIRETTQLLNGKQVILEETKEQLKAFDDLDDMEEDVLAIECLCGDTNHCQQGIDKLKILLTNLEIANQHINKFEKITQAEKSIKTIKAMIEQKQVINNDRNRLKNAVGLLISHDKALTRIKSLSDASKPVQAILKRFEKRQEVMRKRINLRQLNDEMNKWSEDIEKWSERKLKMEDKFHKLMPDQCPLCGQEIK